MSQAPESAPSIRLELGDEAALVTIDRPPLNVLDIETNRLLADTLRSLVDRDGIKVVVLRGAGSKAFSAGVEIRDHTSERIDDMLDAFHGVFRELDRLDLLTIAAVRGLALGGGCELAAFCDLVLAEESALFGFPEIKLGCFPPVAAVLLPTLIGAKRATDLILSGEPVTAGEAYDLGLVSRLVPDGSLDQELSRYLSRFTSKSGAVLRLARQAMRPARPPDFFDELARAERIYREDLMRTEDAREGIEAWLGKRTAEWLGR